MSPSPHKNHCNREPVVFTLSDYHAISVDRVKRNAETGLAMATQEGHFQDFVLYHVIRIQTLQTFLTAIYFNSKLQFCRIKTAISKNKYTA